LYISRNILDYPIVKNILDQSMPIEHATNYVIEKLNIDFEFEKQNPKDMVTLLKLLKEKNAVIIIPEYKSLSGGQSKENEIIISNKNRHGKIIGLIANNSNFSFSIKIIDSNIINENNVGAPRNFRVTNPEGMKGMGKFQILSKFAEFEKMEFRTFVSPDRWIEMFSENYFLSKLLIKRLTMEASYYYNVINDILAEGIKYPETKKVSDGEYYYAKGIKKKIRAFSVDVYVPGLEGESRFPEYEYNQENLINLVDKRRAIIYKIVPKINFMARVIEFAYFRFNGDNIIPESFKEIWGDVSWQPMKIGRTMWDCLKLSNGLEIRKREFEKIERMPE